MSALTEFLHKLVDRAGVSELHSEIDDLDKPASDTVHDDVPVDGGEDTPHATE